MRLRWRIGLPGACFRVLPLHVRLADEWTCPVVIVSSESCRYETLVVYHTRKRTRSAAGTPNGADDHPTRTDTCISTTTAAIMRAQKRSGMLLTGLLQPPYKRSQHIGVVIGPDALSGIGRQERPISGLAERAEILILARHRGDNGDPLLLGRIFLNVGAIISSLGASSPFAWAIPATTLPSSR